MSTDTELYTQDFYAWALKNAELLRQGRLSEIDAVNVAEELESMGKSDKRELLSRLEELLLHLLKWRYQPPQRGSSWAISIIKQRDGLTDLLEDSPSLKPGLVAQFAKAYQRARRYASQETGLPLTTFPATCPFTVEQAIDEQFWPE
jgi:hypothetical protein